VRIPDDTVAQAIVAALGEPILSSSLILPGSTAALTDGWAIKEELDHVVDAVVDGGERGSEPTTVVDFSDGAPEVVRAGAGDPSRFE
jgi:tRNA A37 threonylcarbamoyladenosine synthetase subunit TsaC/SUA5/YrdC